MSAGVLTVKLCFRPQDFARKLKYARAKLAIGPVASLPIATRITPAR